MVDETLDWTGEGPAPLGVVVGGSLSGGLDIRLHPGASVEEAKVGTFVTVQGGWYRFFGIMTDMRLESSDPRFAAAAPGIDPAMPEIAEPNFGSQVGDEQMRDTMHDVSVQRLITGHRQRFLIHAIDGIDTHQLHPGPAAATTGNPR